MYPADRITEIQESQSLGITAEIKHIDFRAIMERMREKVVTGQDHVRQAIRNNRKLDFYEGEARFTDLYTLGVSNKTIRGKRIFIAAGARPLIPDITNLDTIPYLTNETLLRLEEKPASLAIIGGGDIAVEYAHFFAAMGTRVTLFQRNRRLVPMEEPEISDLLKKALQKRLTILTDTEVTEVRREKGLYTTVGKNISTGEIVEIPASAILLAAGRKSNADALGVENTGVATDKRGYIKVNDFFETSQRNIWAFGDILGIFMFRHVANRQALITWHNAMHKEKMKMDFQSAPHAIFTSPQIASVGLTEEQAVKQFKPGEILIGRSLYSDVVMGEAMAESDGFAKAVVEKKTGRILGFHIIGPYSSALIQEVINMMAIGGDAWALGRGMHIHPALPELVISTLNNLHEGH